MVIMKKEKELRCVNERDRMKSEELEGGVKYGGLIMQ